MEAGDFCHEEEESCPT